MSEYQELERTIKEQQIALYKLMNQINDSMKELTNYLDGIKYRISNKWMEEIEHPEWLKFCDIWQDKWISSDYNDELIVKEIEQRVKQINADVAMIELLTDKSEESISIYKRTLNFKEAVKR